MTAINMYHRVVLYVKRICFGGKGEPYQFNGKVLRFTPGTRPVREKYRLSTNTNVRNDALQVALVRDSLSNGDHAIDIGAHAGQYGLLMSSRCGETGTVICFEPDPDAVTKLEENFRLNPQIAPPRLVRKACSDTNGTEIFFTQGGNSQSSLARSALPVERETSEIKVETVRLDDWWERNGRSSPALIKIDIEGAEIHALRGMPHILKTDAVIVVELHPYAWPEFGVELPELKALVLAGGREMFWLDSGDRVGDQVEYGTIVLRKL